jgi:3-keto-5-aminohexanoate cleavage enzyme
MSQEERAQPILLSPEMATLTTGSVNFGPDVFYNPQEYSEYFASLMKEHGVKPEIEVFDVGMIGNALRLVEAGLVSMPLHFDFVMGVPGGIPGTPEQLMHLVNTIPAGCSWTVAGIGRYELPLAVMAVVLGGHVRVGLEDNLYYARGQLAEGNAPLIARVVRIADELGRSVASPAEARKLLGL